MEVYKSFDYANLVVDYKKKTIDVSYPHKMSKVKDFATLYAFGIVAFIAPLGVLLGFTVQSIEPFWFVLCLTILWIYASYNVSWIRYSIMSAGGDDADYNQIYLGGQTKTKKVRISNVGNYFTHYKVFGDYALYIDKFEVKCSNYDKKNKEYKWQIFVEFSRIPKDGYMLIFNKVGGSDERKGDIKVEFI